MMPDTSWTTDTAGQRTVVGQEEGTTTILYISTDPPLIIKQNLACLIPGSRSLLLCITATAKDALLCYSPAHKIPRKICYCDSLENQLKNSY